MIRMTFAALLLSLTTSLAFASDIKFDRAVLGMDEFFETRRIADKEIRVEGHRGLVEYVMEYYQLRYEGAVSQHETAWSFLKKTCWGDCETLQKDSASVEMKSFNNFEGFLDFDPLSRATKQKMTQLIRSAFKESTHGLKDISMTKYYFTDGDEADETGYVFIGNSVDSGQTPDWLIKVSVLRRN